VLMYISKQRDEATAWWVHIYLYIYIYISLCIYIYMYSFHPAEIHSYSGTVQCVLGQTCTGSLSFLGTTSIVARKKNFAA
jgi:hypothetical protein